MIEDLARALHVSNKTFYTLLFGTLIISSLLLGFALNRVLHYWAKRLHNGWGQLFFSLLESLPMPLLLIASLYLGLESLPLPPRFEHVGSKLILALVILVMMYFPAKVIVLALRRAGQQRSQHVAGNPARRVCGPYALRRCWGPSSSSKTWALL